jgi:hypothetical protein
VSLFRKGQYLVEDRNCGTYVFQQIRTAICRNLIKLSCLEFVFLGVDRRGKHANSGRAHHTMAAAAPPVSDRANRQLPRVPRSYTAKRSSLFRAAKGRSVAAVGWPESRAAWERQLYARSLQTTATYTPRCFIPSAVLWIRLGDDSAAATPSSIRLRASLMPPEPMPSRMRFGHNDGNIRRFIRGLDSVTWREDRLFRSCHQSVNWISVPQDIPSTQSCILFSTGDYTNRRIERYVGEFLRL